MSLYKKMYSDFKEQYLMYACAGIIVSSCLGGAAAMAALTHGHGFWEMFQVGLLVAVCMGYNATVLANLNRKTVFTWLTVSVVVSILLLLFHLI